MEPRPIAADGIGGNPSLQMATLIHQRQPAATEAVSSVLEANNEGFRLRRIVGDLQVWAGDVEQNELFDYTTWTVYAGIIVLPMLDDGTASNGLPGNWVHAPWLETDMSESWLWRRVYCFGPQATAPAGSLGSGTQGNHNFPPFGSWVDIRANRRVKPDENVFLLTGWQNSQDLSGTSRIYPSYQRNLRILISR